MTAIATAGIIAAGDGRRLQESHPGLIKPLVPVAGAPLCHWVARSLTTAGARRITVLHNSRGSAVRASLKQAFPDVSWTFLQQDTASSWESFRLVAQALSLTSAAFLVSTVDALIAPRQALRFASAMQAWRAEAGLALTDFIDDEKPLWADLAEDGRIAALGERCATKRWATAGLYYLTAPLASEMPEARRFGSLRAYLGWLVDSRRRVAGAPVDKAVDVDRPQDVDEAATFVKSCREASSW